MKKTLLIFGISSFVGTNLLEQLKNEFRIIGTYFQTPVSIPGVTCVSCDVLKKDFVTNLVSRFRPDLAVYAIGISSLRECSLYPKQADAINSAGAVNCCTATERYNGKFIYLSSAYVFSGEDVINSEGDAPFPNNVYGNTLSSTEFYLQRSGLNYIILRCCNLYGRSLNPTRPNWFEFLESALSKGEPIWADSSIYTGHLDVQIMAKIFKSVVQTDVINRLFHVSSRDSMTRYDFACLYAKIFKKDESLIQKDTGSFPIDKGSETSDGKTLYFRLDTSNLEEHLDLRMPTVEESLVLTQKRLRATSGMNF